MACLLVSKRLQYTISVYLILLCFTTDRTGAFCKMCFTYRNNWKFRLRKIYKNEKNTDILFKMSVNNGKNCHYKILLFRRYIDLLKKYKGCVALVGGQLSVISLVTCNQLLLGVESGWIKLIFTFETVTYTAVRSQNTQ